MISRSASLGVAFVLLAGCGGGSGSVTPAPNPHPSPTQPSAQLVLSASSLSINAVGAKQQLTASENGYTGPLNVDLGSCKSSVTVDTSSRNGPQATFTFTGTAVNTCTAAISDNAGQAPHVVITVTNTTGTLQ